MSALTLSEQAALSPTQIDRQRGVVSNVKVLGRTSKNGKTYSESAMADLCRLGEQSVVYTNHPDIKYAGSRAPRNRRGRGPRGGRHRPRRRRPEVA